MEETGAAIINPVTEAAIIEAKIKRIEKFLLPPSPPGSKLPGSGTGELFSCPPSCRNSPFRFELPPYAHEILIICS